MYYEQRARVYSRVFLKSIPVPMQTLFARIGGLLFTATLLSLSAVPGGATVTYGQEGELTTDTGILNVPPKNESDATGLSVEATIQDSTGDGALTAQESASLEVEVTNHTEGPAANVDIHLVPNEGLEQVELVDLPNAEAANDTVRVGGFESISSGSTQSLTVPIRGRPDLSPTPVSLLVTLKDEYGFAPDEVTAASLGEETAQEPRRVAQQDQVAGVDQEIPKTDTERPNGIAVVVGVKDYEHTDVPDVDYALNDAQTMKKYLVRTLGFREENVILTENASGSELRRLFGTESSPKGQLYNYVREGESEVFVFYSGHGAPNPETERAYLLGADTNPNYMAINGYPLNQLYENLALIPARSVTVALDACFSGVSQGGKIVQNVSPAVLSVENPVISMDNGLAFSAGAANQVSSWYPEKEHGLFTYYFLKGLRGAADQDGDHAITAKELQSYVVDEVSYRARRMHNREQTPQLVGQNKDRVLVRYNETPPANGGS